MRVETDTPSVTLGTAASVASTSTDPTGAALSMRREPRFAARPVVFAAVVAIAGVVMIWWLHHHVVAGLIHSNRQQHLAADFRTGRPSVEPGEAIAVVQIPRLGVDQIVVAGDDPDNLRSGPGLRTDGSLPGVPGVAMIVAHRHGYGAPFVDVPDLVVGDSVVVQTRNLKPVDYRVVSINSMTTDPKELPRLLGPLVAPATARLLLVTGSGSWIDDNVVIVVADAIVPGVGTPSNLDSRIEPRGGSLFNRTMLGVILSIAASVLGYLSLRPIRRRWPMIVCLVSPIVLAWVLLMMSVEDVLASFR